MSIVTRRNIALSVILQIITCGIYGIYWAYCLAKEMVRVSDKDDSGTVEILLMILLPVVGCFLAEKRFYEAHQRMGVSKEDYSILYLILCFFALPVVCFALMQNDLNKLADAFDRGLDPAYDRRPQYQYSHTYARQENPYAQSAADEAKNEKTPIELIKELAELREQGLISEEEYNEKKKKYLDRL